LNCLSCMAMLILSGLIGAIITLIFGILVLIFPKFLRVIVGLWFVLVGILGIISAL